MNESNHENENAVPVNPLVGMSPTDTMKRVACVLRFLEAHTPDDDAAYTSDDHVFGRSLVNQVMIQALEHHV